jgi:carbon-monoxide dehydrogenase medium subunit
VGEVQRGDETVKLPPFAYRAVESVEEATAELAAVGDDAAVLAGGQSLLLDLRYGVARPGMLVDVNRVAELRGVRADAGSLRIGALVRHAELERLPATEPLARLLGRIAPYVAHPPIRALGTFVGSLAWAHPAAEWCALARALDAELQLISETGTRTVAAADWFDGHRATNRRAEELVRQVRLPALPAGTGVGFVEHRRSSASFALAAAVACVEFTDGRIGAARIGLANAAEVPLRAVAAETALIGSDGSTAALAVAADAASQECEPVPEPECSVAYRRHVVGVLVRRALEAALRDASETREVP